MQGLDQEEWDFLKNELFAFLSGLSEKKNAKKAQELHSKLFEIINKKRKLLYDPDAKTCLNDGYPLDDPDKYFRGPNLKKRDGSFDFFKYNFCSLSCYKCYVERVYQFSPTLLTWTTLFAKRELGITGNIPMAPDPSLLKRNRTDGRGLTIEEYRNFEKSKQYTEILDHLPIDRRPWKAEPQVNAPEPFHEIIREEQLLADKLFKDFKEAGKPIPKTLLNDAAKQAQEEAEKKASLAAKEQQLVLQKKRKKMDAITEEEEEKKHQDPQEEHQNEEEEEPQTHEEQEEETPSMLQQLIERTQKELLELTQSENIDLSLL